VQAPPQRASLAPATFDDGVKLISADDDNGRLIQTTFQTVPEENRVYDPAGKLTRIVDLDASGNIIYSSIRQLDSTGRLMGEKHHPCASQLQYSGRHDDPQCDRSLSGRNVVRFRVEIRVTAFLLGSTFCLLRPVPDQLPPEHAAPRFDSLIRILFRAVGGSRPERACDAASARACE
jgi:hypothetical protein